jgi:hypothetical protein
MLRSLPLSLAAALCLLIGANSPLCAQKTPQAPDSEVKVVLTPDRPVWAFRQTITGSIVITNTGTTAATFDPWWINDVALHDGAGRTAESFSILGCILPDPNASRELILAPGQQHKGRFSVCTDRMHSMQSGYYAAPGKWWLTYPVFPAQSMRVACEPVAIEVALTDGQYAGPRITEARAAGPNLILIREGGTIEVLDAATGLRRGSKRPRGYQLAGAWLGQEAVFSSDGRLVAFCPDRRSPIHIESLYGDPPPRTLINTPETVEIGPGGFVARRFSPDDAVLFCTTNNRIVSIGLATGEPFRIATSTDCWPQVSPDGARAGVIHGALARFVGSRGKDSYRVALLDLNTPHLNREVAVAGHGESPELHMGVAGAYLGDEFARSVVFAPYEGGPSQEFETDAPAEFVGETPDGLLMAVAWPWSEHGTTSDPTTVAVYRVPDRSRVCTISLACAHAAAVLSDPPRIAVFPRKNIGTRFSGGHWYDERAVIYDARTGALIKTIDLTPTARELTAPFAR